MSTQYKTILAVDFYKPAAECFKANFPDVNVICDKVENIKEFPKADIVLGGPPCFTGGTLVICERGLIPIKDIIVGDKVLTHTGKWQKVIRTGNKVSSIFKIKGQGSCGIETTDDHHFLAKDKFIKWNNEKRSYVNKFGDTKWSPAKEMTGKYWATQIAVDPLSIPDVDLIGMEKNKPEINNDFWWIVGCWLGDGWIRIRKNKSSVIICSRINYGKEIEEKLNSCKLKYYISKERTTDKYHISSSALARWLEKNFSRGAENKTIPSWMFGMDKLNIKYFIDGYKFADGYDTKSGFAFTTISKKITLGIKVLLSILGHSASIIRCDPKRESIIEGRKVNEKGFWQIRSNYKSNMSFFEDGKKWSLCRSFEDINKIDTVYDIEVEEDHSFTADGIIVHNCQPFSTAGRMRKAKDNRDGMPAFINCVDQIKPRQFLIENVNGFYKCRYRLEIEDALSELGYTVQCKTLDSADFGVPQHRRRCWLWGVRDDLNLTHKWPIGDKKWIGIQEALNHPLEPAFHYINKYPKSPYTEPADKAQPSPPIFSKFHGKNSDLVWANKSENKAYKLSVDDALIIQSVPSYFKWAEKQSTSSKWAIIGNGWASKMGYYFAKAFKETDPKSYTVIDLFCGGGLGSIGWHSWDGE